MYRAWKLASFVEAALGVALFTLFPLTASAVTLQQATVVRPNFGIPDTSHSFDPPGFQNLFTPFLPFTDGLVYQIGQFDGGPGGSRLDVFFLAEVAGYSAQNQFGVINSSSNFESIFDGSDTVGAHETLVQGSNTRWTFALNSPDGRYSAIDQNNPDRLPHILALLVDEAGTVVIPHATLGGLSFSFNLLPGDRILFAEDIGGGLGRSDRDFNDFVGVVRHSSVPEPGSVALLSMGIASLVARRRRKTSEISE